MTDFVSTTQKGVDNLTVDFSSFFTWLKTTRVDDSTINRALFEALFAQEYKKYKQVIFNPYEDDLENGVLL